MYTKNVVKYSNSRLVDVEEKKRQKSDKNR